MERKKETILIISDDFIPAATGVGMHLQIMCAELVNNGYGVVVITSKRTGEPEVEVWNGVKIYRAFSLKIAGFYQALATPKNIRKIIKENNVGIAHFHYWSFLTILAYKSCKGMNLVKLATFHMTEDHLTQLLLLRPLRPIIRYLIKQFCNKMDTVIAPSQNLVERIKVRGVTVPVIYITNPLTRDFFNIGISSSLEKIQKENDIFNVLYVGRLNKEKNIPLLLKAFAEHLRIFPASRLRIAGCGEQEGKLKKLCEELAISKNVEFLGFLPHNTLSGYYRDCNVFVLPSLVEAQAIVVLEAMRFAKPVIVTKEIVSAYELVDDGSNGFIVDGYDHKEMAGRLNELAVSAELQEKMGNESYKRTGAYNPEIVCKQLIDVYQKIAA